jgi:hypothetical protein
MEMMDRIKKKALNTVLQRSQEMLNLVCRLFARKSL